MHYIHRLHVMISNDLLQEPRNAESTSALSQHWVSIKRPAPPLLMLASLVSIVLLGAPLERWQWCTCFMYPARCTIVFSSRIESNRNQSSHGLWPNSSLWWPMQIYAVCVCVSVRRRLTHIHTTFFGKKIHQTCKATYIVYACRQKHHANAKKLRCCAWGSHWADGILGVFNVFVTFVVTSVTFVTFVAFGTFCATLRLARIGSKALVKGHWSLDAHVGLRPVRLSGERSGRGRACFLELPLSGKSSYSMALDGSKWQRRLETPENLRECSQAWRSYWQTNTIRRGKNKLHEVSTAKKTQRERLKQKKETDKTQTMPWQIVTVPNSLCLLSWGETCCFVQYPCIGPYRATLKKNIQVPQELSLWLQLKDTSPAMPQHCVFIPAPHFCDFCACLYEQVQASHVSLTFCSEVQVTNTINKRYSWYLLQAFPQRKLQYPNGVELLIRPTLIRLRYYLYILYNYIWPVTIFAHIRNQTEHWKVG